MSNLKQNSLYAVIILLVIILVFSLKNNDTDNIKGIFLPQTTQTFQSIDADNVILKINNPRETNVNIPENSILIGRINTVANLINFDKSTIQKATEKAIVLTKKLASKNGANFVISYVSQSSSEGVLNNLEMNSFAFSEDNV